MNQIKTVINSLESGSGYFSSYTTSSFDNENQISDFLIKDTSIQNISSVYWSINSSGYVKFLWEGMEDPFMILSGNGSWNLTGNSIFRKPDFSTGKVKIETEGFDDLDAFTVLITGRFIC